MAAESADGDDTDDDLGDWVTLATEEGQTYYYNPRSEESRWERPTMGWSEYQDDWGRTYFHNSATGESAWELPAEATHGPVQVQSAGADAGAGEASPRHDTAATATEHNAAALHQLIWARHAASGRSRKMSRIARVKPQV